MLCMYNTVPVDCTGIPISHTVEKMDPPPLEARALGKTQFWANVQRVPHIAEASFEVKASNLRAVQQ
jgi:hypothetical protein